MEAIWSSNTNHSPLKSLVQIVFGQRPCSIMLAKPPVTEFGTRRRNEAAEPVAPLPSSASLADSIKAYQIVNEVLDIHTILRAEPHLRPGPTVNALLTRLVGLCSGVYNEETTRKVLSHPSLSSILPSLQTHCSDAEFLLEEHWAARVLPNDDNNNHDDCLARLESFPYFSNYEALTRLELCGILSTGHTPRRIAFIGSGPLPLTSIWLARFLCAGITGPVTSSKGTNGAETEVEILNIDRDPNAVALSAKLDRAITPPCSKSAMKFTCSDAASPSIPVGDFDVVYLAALVGRTQADKERILISVVRRMQRGALVVVRTSWGLRRCLYPEFEATTAGLAEWLDVLLVMHPHDEVVNSVIIARVK